MRDSLTSGLTWGVSERQLIDEIDHAQPGLLFQALAGGDAMLGMTTDHECVIFD